MVRLITSILLALTVVLPICVAQSKSDQSDWSDALVKWDKQCSPKGCLLMTDVLRGESGRPPDPKDTHERIGIYVAVGRASRKPAYFAFHVDPNEQQDQGIFIAFTRTTKESEKWKMNIEADGASRVTFSSCDQDSCVARVPDGIVMKTEKGSRLDLLDEFLNSDAVLLLYQKNGHAYRTMVTLSSFKKAYQKLLTEELGPAASTPTASGQVQSSGSDWELVPSVPNGMAPPRRTTGAGSQRRVFQQPVKVCSTGLQDPCRIGAARSEERGADERGAKSEGRPSYPQATAALRVTTESVPMP